MLFSMINIIRYKKRMQSNLTPYNLAVSSNKKYNVRNDLNYE